MQAHRRNDDTRAGTGAWQHPAMTDPAPTPTALVGGHRHARPAQRLVVRHLRRTSVRRCGTTTADDPAGPMCGDCARARAFDQTLWEQDLAEPDAGLW